MSNALALFSPQATLNAKLWLMQHCIEIHASRPENLPIALV